jgi:hypothetical protein
MKKRFSKECYNMTFKNNHKIIIANDKIHLLSKNENLTDFKPYSNKSFWFEIWTFLKSFYGEQY